MLLLCQLGVFRSVPATHTPFHQKSGNFHIFSISGPKSALFGPEWDFGGPCVKPFINTMFWEVFWRPRAGKVHFSPKNWKFRPKTEIRRKCSFFVKKWFFRRNARNLTKCYLFCFKCMDGVKTLLMENPKTPKLVEFGEFHQIWWNSWNFTKMAEILGNFHIFRKKWFLSENELKNL